VDKGPRKLISQVFCLLEVEIRPRRDPNPRPFPGTKKTGRVAVWMMAVVNREVAGKRPRPTGNRNFFWEPPRAKVFCMQRPTPPPEKEKKQTMGPVGRNRVKTCVCLRPATNVGADSVRRLGAAPLPLGYTSGCRSPFFYFLTGFGGRRTKSPFSSEPGKLRRSPAPKKF